MLKSELFSRLEETLQKAQGLMAKLIEQNNQWPGGGAFEKDMIKARTLLKDAQTELIEVGETVIRHMEHPMDIDVNSVNGLFDQLYNLLNLMYHDTKEIKISLQKGESQTKVIKDLEIHLKQFVKHCEKTRDYMLEGLIKS